MRFGVLKSGAMFVTAFAAMFAAMSVGAPSARSQVGLQQRMTVMHYNPQLHFSSVDPTKSPTTGGGEVVGRFVQATAQSSRLVEGHPYPHHIDPDYLYGPTFDGQDIRRVGQTGSPIDITSIGNLFQRVTGAWLIQPAVPTNPEWIPRSYDLKEHFAIVGEVDQTNQSLQGNTTGLMLVNPKTMAAYQIGQTSMFLGQSSFIMFEDVCFGVYPGGDGDYAQIDDNEYRYVMIYSTDQTDDHGLICLSLSKHETMNGTNPPSPWNPIAQERGPAFTNVFPIVTANSKVDTFPIIGEDNGQLHCRSYYARPELNPPTGTFGLATDVTYAIAGWVALVQNNPNAWAPFIQGFSLGNNDPLTAVTGATGLPPAYLTDDIFKGMTIVGDWLLCSVGDGVNGDGFADFVRPVYIPEFLDGPNDGDSGIRANYQPGGSAGFCGYMPNITGHPYITYVGTGTGQSIMYGTTRNPFQNHFAGSGLIENPTPIDMHTEEEKLLGINVRQAPQPFVGFWFSEDPASNFPGFRDGGGSGKGGCSGSAEGGADHAAGLLALVGMSFLLVQVLRESRRT